MKGETKAYLQPVIGFGTHETDTSNLLLMLSEEPAEHETEACGRG